VDPPLTAPTRPGRPVLSAMERIVERERPGYQVERAAFLARAAVRRQPRWSASGVHLPGNGPEDLAAPRPAVPLPRLARTPWSPTPPTLGPCAACGGRTRLATVDLVGDTTTVECIACGLRRVEGAGAGEGAGAVVAPAGADG